MLGRIFKSVAVIAAMVALVACSTVPTAQPSQPPQPSIPSPPGLDAISRFAEPGLYTKAFVAEAIRHYNAEGRDATIAFYNSPESMDGEWYLFIIDEEGLVLAHSAIPENVGLTVTEPLGIDANGYDFGAALLAATEQGGWVSYVYEKSDQRQLSGDQARVGDQSRWLDLRLRLVPSNPLRRAAATDNPGRT